MPHSTTGIMPAPQQTTHTQATFKAGDSVLCPQWGKESYTAQSTDFKQLLEICKVNPITNEEVYFFFNTNGINETFSSIQAVFHDTPANRQAIATLYHGEPLAGVNSFTPSYFERKDGYFKDGIFYCPRYAIFKNGEQIEVGGVAFAYKYEQANHILMHLQAVSDNTFTLEPVAWKAIENYSEVAAVQP